MFAHQEFNTMLARNLYNFGFKTKTFFLKKLIEAFLLLNRLDLRRFD